jgi:hypothetical protein
MRLISFITLALAAVLASTTTASASARWTVSEITGIVSVTSPMAAPHKVVKGETLSPGATVTTGADGHVVFGDGKSEVKLSANSRLTMPADASDLMTRFTQDLGSALFIVEKRPMQHFEVQTRMIAAVVKGTQFTVSADADVDTVSVREGLVEVVAMSGGQKELVPAGQSARVLHNAPTKLNTAQLRSDETRSGAITHAIGAEPLNYVEVTGGLVSGPALPTTMASNGHANSSNNNEAGASHGADGGNASNSPDGSNDNSGSGNTGSGNSGSGNSGSAVGGNSSNSGSGNNSGIGTGIGAGIGTGVGTGTGIGIVIGNNGNNGSGNSGLGSGNSGNGNSGGGNSGGGNSGGSGNGGGRGGR